MAVEAARGCGYRKVGGLYLVGGFQGVPCCRLPAEIDTCPTCGQGVKFSRGIQWVAPELVFKGEPKCDSDISGLGALFGADLCPLRRPSEKMALMWVGEKFYTPETFSKEALGMGVSKRISALPKGLVVGKTRVLLAHVKAVRKGEDEMGRPVYKPGVFMSFVPQRLERIVTNTMNLVADALLAAENALKLDNKAAGFEPTKEAMVDLALAYLQTEFGDGAREEDVLAYYWVYEDVKRGITLVVVPDDDPDHLQAERKKRSVPKRAAREEREQKQEEKYAALAEFE